VVDHPRITIIKEEEENVSISHFASNKKKMKVNLIKLISFVFVGDDGKCEHFAFRFEPKKIK
jgi:hypothetical protein